MRNKTICAIATGNGNGAIAIVRLSGANSISIIDKIYHNSKKKIANQKANTIHFGTIKDKDNKDIDEVLISVFKAPHSYTGEDLIEISCHGSNYIQQKILNLLIKNGAVHAEPGEFTLRAFLNGKLDLSQAEAVADLISSSNEASHKVAMQQIKGGFSTEIQVLRDALLKFISLIELELDFSEEDVEFADRKELKQLVTEIELKLSSLIQSFELGNVIKNGIPVAIIGEPNVGKSTLLNNLLKDDKAIVSNIAGTTRDSIEDTITIKGISFRFIDTAGIRNTNDEIEKLGIEKTFSKIKKSSIVFLLLDANNKLETLKSQITDVESKITNQELILVINKIDLLKNNSILSDLRSIYPKYELLSISAKHNTNIELLLSKLLEKSIDLNKLASNDVIITNTRHFEALTDAKEAIIRVIEGMKNEISNDFLAMDIRDTLSSLGRITGEIVTDEVLGNIFKHFCIGK